MSAIAARVANNLDIWTSAIQRKSGAGRGGGSKRISLYGIERLRALILELAVRGRLVPQDAGDEPAEALLRRIAEGRTVATPVDVSAEKLKLPRGWVQVTMQDIGETFIGLTYSPKDVSDVGIPVLRSSNVQGGVIDLSDLVRVRSAVRPKLLVDNGDILICVRNGSRALVGKCATIEGLSEPTTFGAFMAIFKSPINSYVKVFLESPLFRKLLLGVETTTINQITQSNLKSTLLPLPPLAEQRRIVAKVDELTALCDALERESADAIAAHQALVEALLATLVNSTDTADLATNWARLETHFDTLFTTDASIEALKQTILDLAVRGKLVEQDSADKDATVILAEVQKLMGAKGLLDRKPNNEIRKSELPFGIPQSWTWVRLGSFVKLWNGFAFKSNDFRSDGVPVIRIGDLQNGEVNTTAAMCVPEEVAKQTRPQFWIPENALLIAMSGATTGKTAFNRTGQRLLLNQRVGMLEIFAGEQQYVRYFFETIVAHNLAISAGSAIPNLSAEQINGTWFPLPPLAEQRRIVTKVDTLLALCDRLKSRVADAAQTQRHLADSITERAAA